MKTVVLTDENGQNLGLCEIIDAHTNGGKLHKAFSIFVWNTGRTKLLIQRRAASKMLFGGLWANTCCSHPREEKSLEEEAMQRLQEECGFTCPLSVANSFVYKADDPSGSGTEYEYDTVLEGEVDESIILNPNPEEVAELKWIDLGELALTMEQNPDSFAPWFYDALDLILNS